MADKRRSSRIQGAWAPKRKEKSATAETGRTPSSEFARKSIDPGCSNFTFKPTVKVI